MKKSNNPKSEDPRPQAQPKNSAVLHRWQEVKWSGSRWICARCGATHIGKVEDAPVDGCWGGAR